MALHSRIKRINEELRSAIAAIILEEVKDPRLAHGMVTVSSVEVSKDLHNANVWVSVYGTEEEQKGAMAALEHSRGFIKHALGHRVVLKYLPDLHIRHDASFQYADKINRLLKKIEPLPEDDKAADGGTE